MNPTLDWLTIAEKRIRQALEKLHPKLLEAQGRIEHHLKDDQSVVTELDLLVEHTLRDELARLDGGVGFAGEETGADFTQKTFWLVDPIDGTEAFVRGLPFATNMVALIDNGQPVMGIVYNFSLGEYFLAIKDRGATCNGHPIRVSTRQLKRGGVVLAGHIPDNEGCQHNILRQKSRLVARFNASGYELTAVARGALEGAIVVNAKTKPWDSAPGCLIVQEAGGRAENVDAPGGYNFLSTNIVAANPIVFDDLMRFAQPLLIDKR